MNLTIIFLTHNDITKTVHFNLVGKTCQEMFAIEAITSFFIIITSIFNILHSS